MSKDKFDLTGKIALVTGAGAGGGLGHAMAVGLAGAGADVVVSDIDTDGAATTSQEIQSLGRRSIAITCDNSQRDEIFAMFEEIDKAFGRIDILINNVGAGARYRPEELPFEEWQRVLDISLSSSFVCAVQAGKRMIAQRTGGSIINISSIAGSHALGRGNLPHSVAKSGVNQMTRELATEWGPHGIRVNAIQPATIRTPSWNSIADTLDWDFEGWQRHLLLGIPLGRLGEPDDLVGPAIFLASDAAAFVTGHLLAVDGGNLAMDAGGSIQWPALRKDR
ncbi:MAG: NAD-dependent epimerase/dehydratase [Chloroflexi bacterium]|nr:NAD-dependent epimerase/dehydratase [Chloroflexota bacterium]